MVKILPRKRVAFFAKDNREALLQCAEKVGHAPGEAHYGLGVLQTCSQLEVTPVFVGRPKIGRIARYLDHLRGRLFPQPAVFWSRFSPQLARGIMASQGSWDVVLSADNVATATLLVLRQRRQLHCPVVCLLIGVPDWLESAKPEQRANTLCCLSAADRLVVLGMAEASYLGGKGLTQTNFLPFGVDTEFWAPTGEPVEDYVLGIGSDSGRDYETLIQACPYPLRILTRLRDLTRDPIPPNVSVVRGGGLAEARALISRARLVVVPLKDRLQPSGQSTVLQAMAMSKPVILTRTRGTWTDQLRDRENCIYVRPGDTKGLQDAIESLSNDGTAREIGLRARATVREFFDTRHLADGWMRIIREVL